MALALAAALAAPAEAAERWVPLGPVGGTIRVLAQAPPDPEHLYAATERFGVYRSRDGGLSWQSARRGLEGTAVLALAVAPGDSDVVLATTYGGSPLRPLWRSQDGGATWVPAVKRAAETLGVSKDELAETAIERELATVGAGLEGRLVRALNRLRSYGPSDLERDIREFARAEVENEDPLQARFVESPDAYGIGDLFGHPVERG